ncbi:hypothetical protein [Hydrogenimonas sp.]
MPYLLAALFLVGFGVLLWRAWERDRDVATLLKGAGLVAAGIFFTSFARSMLVYKPLMVLHLAAVLLFWYGTVRYLLRREARWPLLAAPLATMALFFVVAWLFREV